MLKLSNKAQFFILTAVMIVGVFLTLSKYVNQYSFIDTSTAAEGAEIFMFQNIVEKANKTVQISNQATITNNLSKYKNFAQKVSSDRGYILSFDYTIVGDKVNFNITLISSKYSLTKSFTETVPTSP